MKPTQFEGSNVVYAEDQPQYLPLPAHRSEDGCVSTCWQLSFKERLKILWTGRLFLSVLTFNKPLQPLKVGLSFEEVQ